MRQGILRITLLFLSSLLPCFASNTIVTLNVTDADGQQWSNGAWTAMLALPPNSLASAPPFFLKNTTTVVPNQLQSGSLSLTGSASFTVTDVTTIAPGGAIWVVNVCPAATSICYAQSIAASGATLSVNLVPPAIRISATNSRLLAYSDNEVVGGLLGSQYFSVTLGALRVCTVLPCGWTTSAGGGGFSCGTPGGPGIPYWNGSACLIDLFAQFDGAGNLIANSGLFSSGVTAQSLGTTGPGGILSVALQNPPTSVPSGTIQMYGDLGSGLVGCRNNALTSCMGSVQIIASGSTVLQATVVTANGGCNLYTSTATGASSTNAATVSVHGVDVTGVSGYAPGQLWIYPPFLSTNLISFKVCNPTTGNITPASLTVFWNILPQ